MSICNNCGGIGYHQKWCAGHLDARRTHETPCAGRHCAECTPTATTTHNERAAA